jgi:ABC-type proline/glycine betaine transport system permease subunit
MWRMVWEQHSYSIVMVTSLFELNRVSNNIVISIISVLIVIIIAIIIAVVCRHRHSHRRSMLHGYKQFM